MKTNKTSGFTLLEILVVVMIISVLAAVVGVHVAGEPGRARVVAAKAQIKSGFGMALEIYRKDNGIYPSQEQGLNALVRMPETEPVPGNYAQEGYLNSSKIPVDPWGNPYLYLNPGLNGERYVVMTYGADGKPGGEGEKADISSADM